MFRIVYFAVPAISVMYYCFLLFNTGMVTKFQQLSIICITLIFMLSTFLMRAPESEEEPEKPAQRFVIGTTVQLLLSLAFLLYSRFAFAIHFREVAITFIVLFIPMLLVQSFFLLKNLKK